MVIVKQNKMKHFTNIYTLKEVAAETEGHIRLAVTVNQISTSV